MCEVTFGDLRRAVAVAAVTVPDDAPVKVTLFQEDLDFMPEIFDIEAWVCGFDFGTDGWRRGIELVINPDEAVWEAIDGTEAYAARDRGRLHIYMDRLEAECVGSGKYEEVTIHVR